MISEDVLIFIDDLSKKSDLDFTKLLTLINDNDINIFGDELVNAFALTTFYEIYLNLRLMKSLSCDMVYFIILHEICHYKRIQKLGKPYHLNKLSENDIHVLHCHIVDEEIISDKYASFVFRLLNNKTFPYEKTQKLNDVINHFKFYSVAESIHGKIQNSEENYMQLINNFIVKK